MASTEYRVPCKAERIARTERIVGRRRRILQAFGGSANVLWNRVKKHNLTCACAICQGNREWMAGERKRRKLAGKSVSEQLVED